MPNTHPTGGAGNRDVSNDHPRLFSIPDGRRGSSYGGKLRKLRWQFI